MGKREDKIDSISKVIRSLSPMIHHLLPKPVGLFCAKALFWDEKRLVPVFAVPNKLLDVPVDAPNPKPVLVEVAGWLNELVPNNPPGRTERRGKLSRNFTTTK